MIKYQRLKELLSQRKHRGVRYCCATCQASYSHTGFYAGDRVCRWCREAGVSQWCYGYGKAVQEDEMPAEKAALPRP